MCCYEYIIVCAGVYQFVYHCIVCRIVPVCEPSVIIAVSSVHRKEAIEATSYAIDAIKSSVTVWKKVR